MSKTRKKSQSVTPFVHYELLEEICRDIHRNDQKIKDHHLASLYQLFDATLLRALRLIDQNYIELVRVEKTPRTFFVVQGSKKIYTLYTNTCYCQCENYKRMYLAGKPIVCKHILGSRLAVSMGKCPMRTSSKFVHK